MSEKNYINISDPFRVVGNGAVGVDYTYGPYKNLAEAYIQLGDIVQPGLRICTLNEVTGEILQYYYENGLFVSDRESILRAVDGKVASNKVTIGYNGNWFIGGVDTGYSSIGTKGDPGKDGTNGKNGLDGASGLSAYDIYKLHGGELTESEWLSSLVGEDGKSAYQTYVETTTDRPIKTPSEWIESLDGKDGLSAYDIYRAQCSDEGEVPLSKEDWINSMKGTPGKSAYQCYKDGVPAGQPVLTEAEWLASLVGNQGKSAYLSYVDTTTDDPVMTESEWLESLDGDDGLSAYDIYLAQGGTLSKDEWLASLVGPAGSSAYDVYKEQGGTLTKDQWLKSLIGASGKSAYESYVATTSDVPVKTETEWIASLDGDPGLSAYDVYVAQCTDEGETPLSKRDWLNSLKGEEGKSAYQCYVEGLPEGETPMTELEWLDSLVGNEGKSAYQIYLDTTEDDPVKSESEWLESLDGKPGLSAYDIYVALGGTLTESEWLASLHGKDAENVDYLVNAIQDGSTTTEGGLVLTSVLALKDLEGNVTSGMSGISLDNILMWGGGTYQEAAYAVSHNYAKSETGGILTTLFKNDGTGKVGCLEVKDTSTVSISGENSLSLVELTNLSSTDKYGDIPVNKHLSTEYVQLCTYDEDYISQIYNLDNGTEEIIEIPLNVESYSGYDVETYGDRMYDDLLTDLFSGELHIYYLLPYKLNKHSLSGDTTSDEYFLFECLQGLGTVSFILVVEDEEGDNYEWTVCEKDINNITRIAEFTEAFVLENALENLPARFIGSDGKPYLYDQDTTLSFRLRVQFTNTGTSRFSVKWLNFVLAIEGEEQTQLLPSLHIELNLYFTDVEYKPCTIMTNNGFLIGNGKSLVAFESKNNKTDLIFLGLPISDPNISGQLWVDNGVLKISRWNELNKMTL